MAFLKKIGVTHVLNTAEGNEEGLVNLSPAHYEGSGISYLGFPLWDTVECNAMPYFGCAAEFIASALDEGGKCMVNCQMGISRSSSCAMAYLLIKLGMTAPETLTLFRRQRDVRPNDGFLEQIAALDNELRRERLFGIPMTIHLSTLTDHPRLPKAWNREFWTKPVTPEEVDMPYFVPLGEPRPSMKMATPLSPSLMSSQVLYSNRTV